MSTKAPSSVKESPADALEKIAYGVIADIPTREPNDRNRLGYCLWIWLKDRQGTLEQAIRHAGVRSTVAEDEIVQLVRQRLDEYEKTLPRS